MHILIALASYIISFSCTLIGAPRDGAPAVTPLLTDPLDTILFVQNTQIPPLGGTLNSVARFSNGSLNNIKNSPVFIDDNGNIQLNGIIKNNIILSWPTTEGLFGQVLTSDGAGNLFFSNGGGGGGGNVSTASAFTADNRLVRTDTPSGSTNIQQSGVTLDDSNNLSGLTSVTATTFNGNLNGNATTATTATNFSGSLSGDVTGTQNATVVSFVGGQSAANVASATIAANAATSANTPNTIVKRDSSGNFSANTITAVLAGSASGDLPLSGGTLTGTLTLPAGSAASPSLQFTGSTNTGLSAATANTLSFDTNGAERMKIGPTGTITVDGFTPAGVVHNDSSGNLSTSLIVNNDITNATISNAKLATISSRYRST
jgi:hypothetical protein